VSGVQSEFIGYVSHPSLGEGQFRGVIRFVQWRLRFENESVTHELPLTRVVIDVESEDEERICFYDPNDPDWRICTPDTDILAHRTLLQQAHTRNQIRQLQSAPDFKRRLKLIGGFAAGFVVLCLLGSLALGVMVRILVHRVPPEWEAKLGADVMKDIRRQATFLDDTNLLAQLEWDVAPLTNALPPGTPPCKYFILDDPLPNAFALPGGYVVVNKGLMRLADSPEDVAGVVAHELAHVTEKHGLRHLISAAGPFFVVKTFFGGGEGMLGALGAGSQLLVRQSFSQEYETEADDTGWQYLVKARIDPRGLAGMLQKLEDAYSNMNGIRPELGAFSSHPATQKRIARLNAKWNALKKKPEFIQYGEPPAQR
jgi:Zn-dependent protease with chaperone function